MENIIIIGAGLSGLHLAYLLKKEGIEAKIIEARPRLGGRIYSKSNTQNTSIELGATWVWRHHPTLLKLIQELGLEIFQQRTDEYALYQGAAHMPVQLFKIPPQEPSFRIVGGTHQIIQALAQPLESEQIHLSEIVESIALQDQFLTLKTNQAEYQAAYIVSTLPPHLLVNSIDFTPELPSNFLDIAQNTHTWMGDSIKVGLRYTQPFWREKNKSGTLFSQVGPVIEMYDHSNFEENQFALKGFLNPMYAQYQTAERKQLVVEQLIRFLGQEAAHFESYEEAIWEQEPFTFGAYDQHVIPHQNNGDAVFQKSYLEDRFFLAGAEVAPTDSGYMNGAVKSAENVFRRLLEVMGKTF